MKKVVLSIDTSSREAIGVAVDTSGKRFEKISQVAETKAQMVLPMLEELLKEHNLTISDITQVKVHTGPGSFTGLRVGLSVANTLSWLLDIPVNSKPPGTILTPVYK